jgi:hypothetical protein
MTFYVVTAASMKMATFWDIAPCSFIEVYRRFGGAYSSVIAMVMEVNVGLFQRDYTALYPRRLANVYVLNPSG